MLPPARNLLDEMWAELSALPLDELPVDAEIGPVIREILDGKEKGWRHSIYIQILGKATDFRLNALCLQQKFDGKGAWDAREFAKSVVVPWRERLGVRRSAMVAGVFDSPRLVLREDGWWPEPVSDT